MQIMLLHCIVSRKSGPRCIFLCINRDEEETAGKSGCLIFKKDYDKIVDSGVGSEPKLGLAQLGSPCFPKSLFQLGLLYHLKNQVILKNKNELISNNFANFLKYIPEKHQ